MPLISSPSITGAVEIPKRWKSRAQYRMSISGFTDDRYPVNRIDQLLDAFTHHCMIVGKDDGVFVHVTLVSLLGSKVI